MRKSKGFTLIELLIVMTVIIILAGILIPSFRGFQNDAWIVKAESEIGVVQTAVESYYRNHRGTYPDSIQDLLKVNPKIIPSLPEDPFKTDKDTYGYKIVYKNPGKEAYYVIYSHGPNHEVDWTWDASKGVVILAPGSDDILLTNAILE